MRDVDIALVLAAGVLSPAPSGGGSSITVDDALSDSSENPVQNKVIAKEVSDLKSALDTIVRSGAVNDTASGSIASFTDGADNVPVKDLTVAVEPVQDLHGYDNPWPAGGGVNLLDPAKCSAVGQGGAYGLTVTHDQATAIWTISGTPTSQNASLSFNFCTYSDFSLSGKGYQVQAFPISGTPIKNIYGFRNEAENKIAIIIDTVANPTVNMTFKVSVAATAQTAWSPYSNICPISGWTGANVYHSGADTSDATTYSITFPSEAGTVYGGTLDVTTGKLTVDRAMVTFDGSADETWTYSSSYTKTNTAVFYTSALADAYYPDWSNYRGYIINLFPNATRDYLYNNDVECMGFTGMAGVSASPTVRIFKTHASNETEFRSFLNNNPIQFVYKLATPIVYDLTPIEVTTLLAQNNIWADCGDSTVNYRADTKLYIDKKIAAPASPAPGQYLSWNGSAWVAASLPVYNGGVA